MYPTPAFQTVLVILHAQIVPNELALCCPEGAGRQARAIETLHFFSCPFLRCLILKRHQSFSIGSCHFCESDLHHESRILSWPWLLGLFFADLLDRNVIVQCCNVPTLAAFLCFSFIRLFIKQISAFLLKLFFLY